MVIPMRDPKADWKLTMFWPDQDPQFWRIHSMNKFKPESPSSIEDHLAKLFGRINYERQLKVTPRSFKLRNMREILSRLDNPHLKYPVIHVAGTKGKGSTCTMIGQILTESGRRTGVYTSPHLETIHQRMKVDGNLITDDQLVETLTQMEPVVAAMDQASESEGFRPLTFFEITTAAALLFFANQNCEAVVLEVGLGGRLDSTNVCEPTACIITNISIDHTRQLGSTVDKIAFEKAGIIKPGIPVISGAIDPLAAEVIERVASEKNAPLHVLDRDFKVETSNSEQQTFKFTSGIANQGESNASDSEVEKPKRQTRPFELSDLKLGMIGQHQRVNAAVCLATIATLNQRDWNISDQAIRTGLKRASLSGRTEVVSHWPTVVIDMAHNEASIDALVETLKTDLPQWNESSNRILIVAISRDKDAHKILRPLIVSFDKIVLTKYKDNPRGRCESELLEIGTEIQAELRSNSNHAAEMTTMSNPEAAWDQVSKDLASNDSVCITGSAFLVAELRKTVLGWAENLNG